MTACTAQRKPLHANQPAFELITQAWREAHEWQVGRFVVMPDHVHFFCSPASHESRPLEKWMQYWKAVVTKRWPASGEKPIWQPSHWDRQLRQADRYGDKREYVRWNPVRHGLVKQPEDWAYQGELNVLIW